MFFYQSSNSISDFYLSLSFPKKAKLCVLKMFWLVAQKGKDNREISHRDDHNHGDHGCLIEVVG